MLIHICGRCGKSFKDEASYLKHRCSVTGFRPTQPTATVKESKLVYQKPVKMTKVIELSEKDILASIKEARGKKA